TERVNAPVVPLVKLLEGFHIAFGSFLRQLVIRRSRCLGFDTSHRFARAHACISLNHRPAHKDSGRNDCFEGAVLVSDLTLEVTSGGAVPVQLTQIYFAESRYSTGPMPRRRNTRRNASAFRPRYRFRSASMMARAPRANVVKPSS